MVKISFKITDSHIASEDLIVTHLKSFSCDGIFLQYGDNFKNTSHVDNLKV